MAQIKIIYGTVGGNTELVCKRVEEVLAEKGHAVQILKAKIADPADLGEWDLLVLACPTYGIGELEDYFEAFLGKLDTVDLKGRKCAVIGLGDPKYDPDYHLESAKIIMEFLKKKEARVLYMPLRISRSPLPLIQSGFVDRWCEKIDGELSANAGQ